jgi:tetratricopeptide (TPR) repeat protein
MRITTITLFLLATIQITGCGGDKTTSLDKSLQEYSNGQWNMSELWAKKSLDEGENIEESQYMLGLCEFQLQNQDRAKEWFEKASNSNNPEVKGKATAMIAIISDNQGDYKSAELAYNNASKYLQGVDKQKAVMRSGATSQANNFTLQFGAYQKKTNAEKAIESISQALNQAGLGRAWITEETSNAGRKMFLVQAGHFLSRTSASTYRDKNKLPTCIVAVSP